MHQQIHLECDVLYKQSTTNFTIYNIYRNPIVTMDPYYLYFGQLLWCH